MGWSYEAEDDAGKHRQTSATNRLPAAPVAANHEGHDPMRMVHSCEQLMFNNHRKQAPMAWVRLTPAAGSTPALATKVLSSRRTFTRRVPLRSHPDG